MAKKLLSETQMRRFATLACIPALHEAGYYNRDEEELEEGKAGDISRTDIANQVPKGFVNEQEEEEDEELLPDEEMPPVGEEPPMDDLEGEPEMDMGAGEELELTDEEAMAIIDLGKKLEAALPAGAGEPDLGEEPPMDMDGEPPIPEPEEEDETEEIMEVLKGINYLPEKKEIVEEVARRVAKRLLKAKRAERQLQEALGSRRASKPTRRPRRRNKK